jgi:dienelactone hydrolase
VVDGLGRARATTENHERFGTVDVWWRPGTSGSWQMRTYGEKDNRFYPQAVMTDERYVLGWQVTPDLDLSIARLDTTSGNVEVVSRKPDHDPIGFLILGLTRAPIAVNYQLRGVEHLEPLAAADEGAIGRLEKHFAGYRVDILDAMPDGKNWLMWVGNSQLPGAYLLFNHETSEAAMITLAHDPSLTEDKLAPAEYFRFPSRHGDALSAMMWRPKDKPNAPLIVVCPENLPALTVRDAFVPRIQAWVRLGYAVVRVNVHNSWGFGKAGRQPGPERWIPALQEDLEDAAKFLASQKAADPSRLFLFGDDFGGVLALQVAARSKVFAAVGTINIPRELHRDDLHRLTFQPGSNPLATKLGGWLEGEKFAQDLSPLAVVRDLEIPAIYLCDEDSFKGTPKQDGRAIRDAVKKSKTTAETGLAYSWTQYPMLPTQRAREGAEIAIKFANFFDAHPAAAAK